MTRAESHGSQARPLDASDPTELARFLGQHILVVVAHQDDESLYFGGLLTLIAGRSRLTIVSTTAPMPGRPDTDHRLASFERVGSLLQCQDVRCLQLPDCGPRGASYDSVELTNRIANGIAAWRATHDLVITHGQSGEPNAVYGAQGHEAHKATFRGVMASGGGPVVSCALGTACADLVFEYDRPAKQALLDCYSPWWTPKDYPFALEAERYCFAR